MSLGRTFVGEQDLDGEGKRAHVGTGGWEAAWTLSTLFHSWGQSLLR